MKSLILCFIKASKDAESWFLESYSRDADALMGVKQGQKLGEMPFFSSQHKAKLNQAGELGKRLGTRFSLDTPQGVCLFQGEWLPMSGHYAVLSLKVTFTDEVVALGETEKSKIEVTGRIAAAIAHEVRNPLTNIQLSVEQMRHKLGDEGKSSSVYFDIIQKSSQRINQLIGELIAATKHVGIRLEQVDVIPTLEAFLNAYQQGEAGQSLKLEKDFAADLPLVKANEQRLCQSFKNLIDNAVQSGADVLKLLVYRQKNKVYVVLEDNGVGIPAIDIEYVYAPFFSAKKKGLGLGLTYVYNFVNYVGGSISIKSEVNKGTLVKLGFKVAASQQKATLP